MEFASMREYLLSLRSEDMQKDAVSSSAKFSLPTLRAIRKISIILNLRAGSKTFMRTKKAPLLRHVWYKSDISRQRYF